VGGRKPMNIPAGYFLQPDGSYSKLKKNLVSPMGQGATCPVREKSGTSNGLPLAGPSKLDENHRAVKSPVLERRAQHALPDANQIKATYSGKLAVIVTSFRRRLLDEDNLAVKWHVDALRYAGIIPDDAPEKVSIKARQEKVSLKEDERTEIEITEIIPGAIRDGSKIV